MKRGLLCICIVALVCVNGFAQGTNGYSSLQRPTVGQLPSNWFSGLSGGGIPHLTTPSRVLGDIPAILDKYEMPIWVTSQGNTEWDDRQNRALYERQTKEVMDEIDKVKDKLLPAQTTKECYFTLTTPLRPLKVYNSTTSLSNFPYANIKFYAPYKLKANAESFWPLKTLAIFISADGYAYVCDMVREGIVEKMEGNIIVSVQVNWRNAYVMNNLSQVVFVHYTNDHWSLARKSYDAMEKQASQRRNTAQQEALKNPSAFLQGEKQQKGTQTYQASSKIGGQPNGKTGKKGNEKPDGQQSEEKDKEKDKEIDKEKDKEKNREWSFPEPHWEFIHDPFHCGGAQNTSGKNGKGHVSGQPSGQNKQWKRTRRLYHIGWWFWWWWDQSDDHRGVFIPKKKVEEQQEEEQQDEYEGYVEINSIEFAFALFLANNFDAAKELITQNEELEFKTTNDKKTYFSAGRTIGDKENIWIDRADKKSQEITHMHITVHQWEDEEIENFLMSLGFGMTGHKDNLTDIVPSVTCVFTSNKYPVTIDLVFSYTGERILKVLEFRRNEAKE